MIVADFVTKEKYEKWILLYKENEKSNSVVTEITEKEDVFMKLLELHKKNVKMSLVLIYPPKSNLNFDEFMSMKA